MHIYFLEKQYLLDLVSISSFLGMVSFDFFFDITAWALFLFLVICRECREKHEEKMSIESEWIRLKANTESVKDIMDQ